MWLHNTDWKVSPTISFVDWWPGVLTFKYHDGGCNLIQINSCRRITHIPSPVSDQVCHAIVKPRTVKHMKVGYNSAEYQMVKQRSSWKRPYTINISSVWKTYHGSILIQKSEARSYANRKDMKSLIQRLTDDEKTCNDHAEGIKEFTKKQEMLTTWNTHLDQIMFLLKSRCQWEKKRRIDKLLG